MNNNNLDKGDTVNKNSRSNRLLSLAISAVVLTIGLPAMAADIPSSPDGTVRAVAEGLADRHPEVLWQALPPTYQNDITELTHAFADKMDPAVWDAAFALGSRTAALLREKKDIILSSSMVQAAGDKAGQVEDGWDEMAGLLDSFFASGVSSLETLQTIDWEQFLATTGRDLMNLAAEKSKADGDDTFDREFTQKLLQTEVELVSNEGGSAVVRMTAPDEEPEEMQLTRVEGRWVPNDMSKDWKKEVTEAKQKLAAITEEEIQQGSMQAMMMIGMVDGVLAELETVETAEEFEQALQSLLGPFLGGMMGPDEEEPGEVANDEPDSE